MLKKIRVKTEKKKKTNRICKNEPTEIWQNSNHKTGVFGWRLQQIIVGEFAVQMGGVLYKLGWWLGRGLREEGTKPSEKLAWTLRQRGRCFKNRTEILCAGLCSSLWELLTSCFLTKRNLLHILASITIKQWEVGGHAAPHPLHIS